MGSQAEEAQRGEVNVAKEPPPSGARPSLERNVASAPRAVEDLPPESARSSGRSDAANRRVARAALTVFGAVALSGYGVWLARLDSINVTAQNAGNWFRALTLANAGGYALVIGPALLAGALALGLLVRQAAPRLWDAAKPSLLAVALLASCVGAIAFLSTVPLAQFSAAWWVYFVAVVPPLLLAYHALVAWRQRPRSVGGFSIGVPGAAEEALKAAPCWKRYEAIYEQLVGVFGGTPSVSSPPRDGKGDHPRRSTPHKGNRAFFITHYAIPALLLGVVGFGAVSLAIAVPQADLNLDPAVHAFVQRGLRWGVAGAFVYVLMDFGSRLYRGDLTVGAAVWAIVTLITGPALAVLLATAWKLEPTPDSAWGVGVVLFFAGLAPRRVVSIVESAALQLLKVQATPAAPPKVTPLTNLRGITPEIAARLREENIDDVRALAYADPIRLVRNVPYDLRQVIDWIDQALLATSLPQDYEKLMERGVTGAIDLSWRWLTASIGGDAEHPRITPLAPADAAVAFADLSDGDADGAKRIYEAAEVLFYEEQVCLLWVMYNCFSTTVGSAEATS